MSSSRRVAWSLVLGSVATLALMAGASDAPLAAPPLAISKSKAATSPASASARAAEDSPPLQPRDVLTGLPFVSCRNWAIADGKAGTIVAESAAHETVDVASTTKIMTAYVILRLAADDEKVLAETVTFSNRAAQTAGSSCGLRLRETMSVRDLMYGMLLPSGNDAAVALAEHFGKRFEPASAKSSTDPLARFVAEMNRAAKRMELSSTRYLNPNGLPEKGHASSARDLARLTIEAHQLARFREIVAARDYSADAVAPDGSRRTIAWKTTNRLLAIEGYTGVKTGYTRAAGSCLVSSGQRGRDELIVVVLGAPSAAAAVADSRNLYRWAWRERGHRD